jgi:argininosuccinate synthase
MILTDMNTKGPIIARSQVRVAEKYKCEYLSHGCTGKGVRTSTYSLPVSDTNSLHRMSKAS